MDRPVWYRAIARSRATTGSTRRQRIVPWRSSASPSDFGPTLTCEKLRECHGIRLAKETVAASDDSRRPVDATQTASAEDLPATRPLRVFRRPVQIDGSDHRWFENQAPACTGSLRHRLVPLQALCLSRIPPTPPNRLSRFPGPSLPSACPPAP